jgi:hypothetical protein
MCARVVLLSVLLGGRVFLTDLIGIRCVIFLTVSVGGRGFLSVSVGVRVCMSYPLLNTCLITLGNPLFFPVVGSYIVPER